MASVGKAVEQKWVNLSGGRRYLLRQITPDDATSFGIFLESLTAETRRRYRPHPLTRDEAVKICESLSEDPTLRVLAEDESGRMVGYVMAEFEFPQDEVERYESYGLPIDPQLDARIAPAVADDLQGQGLGTPMLAYAMDTLGTRKRRRVVLFGGTQATNPRAVRVYEKVGFKEVGRFYHKGLENIDMWAPAGAPDV